MMRMEFIFEIFKNIPRQGPGCREATRKAFEMLTDIPQDPRILDIGCGTGAQTLELARLSDGHVVALDNHEPYLEELKRKAAEEGLSERIETVCGSMFDLKFDPESFDVLWAEGAVYIIGFERGLRDWKTFLKPEGYMAVSELAWLKSDPPHKPLEFLNSGYPAMKSTEENISIIQECDYALLGCFVLPERAWWDDYYTPLEKRLRMLGEKYAKDVKAMAEIEETYYEIALYKKFSDWYGYVFYIMRK